MSSRTPDLLSSLFSAGVSPVSGGVPPATLPRRVLAMKAGGTDRRSAGDFTPPAPRKRTAIWDMHHSVH
jgi:hypothetical protein